MTKSIPLSLGDHAACCLGAGVLLHHEDSRSSYLYHHVVLCCHLHRWRFYLLVDETSRRHRTLSPERILRRKFKQRSHQGRLLMPHCIVRAVRPAYANRHQVLYPPYLCSWPHFSPSKYPHQLHLWNTDQEPCYVYIDWRVVPAKGRTHAKKRLKKPEEERKRWLSPAMLPRPL